MTRDKDIIITTGGRGRAKRASRKDEGQMPDRFDHAPSLGRLGHSSSANSSIHGAVGFVMIQVLHVGR